MSYFRQNPEARKAYRARWADAWAKLLQSGGYSSDEQEEVRIEILKKEAGVTSSNDLNEKGYTKVMMHLGMLLGEGESKMKNPWRARRIYKIEEIAKELRPADPESYIIGVLDDMGIVRDPAKWRTALTDDYLHNTMVTMVSQQRREAAKKKEEVGGGPLAEGGGRRGVTPVKSEEVKP